MQSFCRHRPAWVIIQIIKYCLLPGSLFGREGFVEHLSWIVACFQETGMRSGRKGAMRPMCRCEARGGRKARGPTIALHEVECGAGAGGADVHRERMGFCRAADALLSRLHLEVDSDKCKNRSQRQFSCTRGLPSLGLSVLCAVTRTWENRQSSSVTVWTTVLCSAKLSSAQGSSVTVSCHVSMGSWNPG